MRITIVGSGHGGCAMAAVMAKHGHAVSILKLGTSAHLENFEALEKQKAVKLLGIEGSGEFALDVVGRDPSQSVPNADLLLVYYVANYHRFVAHTLAQYLHRGQTVVLNPGYAGSLIFKDELQKLGNSSVPLFAEFETLPYSSRIVAPGSVSIVSRNVRHPFATYPASRSGYLVDKFKTVLGECVPRKHILEVALHNPNLVIHTIGVLMNASRVEDSRNKFSMYRDGFSPAVWNVVFALDAEKMAVLERIGAPRIPYFDEFRLRTFEDTGIESLKGFHNYALEAPDGPFTVDHRYVTEDAPIGLGLLQSLGSLVGVPTPICNSLLHLAAAMLPTTDIGGQIRTIPDIWPGSLDDLLAEISGVCC